MIRGHSALPTVSVILPVRNEAEFIAMAIASIRRQSYPAELVEVIVVDNGSTDDSVSIAESAGARVIMKLNGRVGSVRNEGAKQARGEVLAFLDSDCEAGEFWLADAVRLLHGADRIGLVGGTYLAPAKGRWIERAWAPTMAPEADKDVGFLPGSGMVVSKKTFERLGGFDEELEAAEDDDFSRRVRELGLRVVSASRCAVVHHGFPRTLYATAKRQVWHGSNQLESSTGVTDRVLLLTHLFLVSELMLFVGAFFRLEAGGLGLLMMFAIVAASSTVRVRRLGNRRSPLLGYLQVLLVTAAYFVGRSIGLIKNYWKLIKSRLGRRA